MKENLKKHFARKIASIILLAVLVIALAYSIYSVTNQYVVIGLIIGVMLLFWLMDRWIDKRFDKWEVPELDIGSKRKFLLVDTYYSIGMALLLYVILGMYVYRVVLLIAFTILISIKEFKKWRNFKKEIKDEVEEVKCIEKEKE